MSSPADRTVAHITFKRDRKSGSYVPDKSYPSLSPFRVSPALSRRRHSSVLVDTATGKEVRTLDSLLAESSRAGSRARSRLRQSVRASSPAAEEERPTPSAHAVDEQLPTSTPLAPRPAPPVSSTPLAAPPQKLHFDTFAELHLALASVPPSDLAGQRALTDLITSSHPYLPRPSLPLLLHTTHRLLHPKPLPHLLPTLITLLAQIELHRQLYVSQALAALSLHAQLPKGAPGRLGREARRRLREVGGEKLAQAQRRKWWVLTLHLRKTHIREMLTLDPHADPRTLLSAHFPPPGSLTLSTTHLLPSEQGELRALEHACRKLITSVSLWASAFTGTPEQAQAEFDTQWELKPGWGTTVDIVDGYLQEVLGAEGALREVFDGEEEGEGEGVKIEPLEEMEAPKVEPISPAQGLVRVLS